MHCEFMYYRDGYRGFYCRNPIFKKDNWFASKSVINSFSEVDCESLNKNNDCKGFKKEEPLPSFREIIVGFFRRGKKQ